MAENLAPVADALRAGRIDDAVMRLEALADRGVVGSGVAFDRGLAYAARAQSSQSVPGDLGRAAHAFEEAIRRDPRDHEAHLALDEVRHEIARRNAMSGGRAVEVGAQPAWRTVVVAAPSDVWVGLAMAGSLALACALALRPRLQRGFRLAASTVAASGFVVALLFGGLGLSARFLRLHVREAVVVVPTFIAAPDDADGPPLDLPEGARVDVLEERATRTHVRSIKGSGWIPREAVRLLPPWRP